MNHETEKENQSETLRRFFEFEVCAECGLDADQHVLGLDALGLDHVICKAPVDWAGDDAAAAAVFAARCERATKE